MNKSIAFLLFYTFLWTVILYGVGTAYDISSWVDLDVPEPPSTGDIFTITLWQIQTALTYLGYLWIIPLNAYGTLAQIAGQYPSIAVFIMIPALIAIWTLLLSFVRIIRGSG